jgi:hypothetical protein
MNYGYEDETSPDSHVGILMSITDPTSFPHTISVFSFLWSGADPEEHFKDTK